MGLADADRLQEIIQAAEGWPMWAQDNISGVSFGTYTQAGMFGKSLRDIALWQALRESDRDRLDELLEWPPDRDLRLDPIPERISTAYADLLYADDVEVTAPDAADQDNYDELVEENDFNGQLYRWVDWSVSEGEVWWRVWVDKDVSDCPLVEANSRMDVIPLFSGRKIMAAAFVADIITQEIRLEDQVTYVVWRHIEIQTDGLVRNLLYKGDLGSLGARQDLGTDPDGLTDGLPAEWNHGLKVMLAGRVPNKLGRDYRLGISEYDKVKDLILDLNEARTIMAENARNTAKARMIVPASAIDESGKFDAGKDVIVHESLDESLDQQNKTGPYMVLEYMFQAAPLLEHIHALEDTINARCGLAVQFTMGGSRGGEGQAFTGTALRTRLLPTTLASRGKARYWDKAGPTILQAMAMVSQLAIEKGGLGRTWANVKEPPKVQRGSILPEDINEETQRHVMAVQGEIESVETAVKDQHPDWDDEEIQAEVDKIRQDRTGPEPIIVTPETVVPPGQTVPPGEHVTTQSDVTGARQPGSGRPVDGQSPGSRPPVVKAGGPK